MRFGYNPGFPTSWFLADRFRHKNYVCAEYLPTLFFIFFFLSFYADVRSKGRVEGKPVVSPVVTHVTAFRSIEFLTSEIVLEYCSLWG